MRPEEVRGLIEMVRSAAELEARTQKQAQLPLERLRAAYCNLEVADRAAADQCLVEWLASDDENRRFDALALVDDFRIKRAQPALRLLRERLKLSKTPGAPFEIEKVDRLISVLAGGMQDRREVV
jgi:hypothetical protein